MGIFSNLNCGFPGASEVKASACNAGDLGLIPGSGRSPGEVNGNPLQYSCLENPMDEGAWWATYSPWGPNWRIPWTEEPGGHIESMGYQRVRHD